MNISCGRYNSETKALTVRLHWTVPDESRVMEEAVSTMGQWLSTVVVHVIQNELLEMFKFFKTNSTEEDLDLPVNKFYNIVVPSATFST